MTEIRLEMSADIAARETLLDDAFGEARFVKTCERLREGRLPALSLVAQDEAGRLVGTVRLWNVRPAPAAPPCCSARSPSTGRCARRASAAADARRAEPRLRRGPQGGAAGRRRAVLRALRLFAELTEGLWLPGPVDRERFLGFEFRHGALAGARGLVSPTGLAARSRIGRTSSPPLRRRSAGPELPQEAFIQALRRAA